MKLIDYFEAVLPKDTAKIFKIIDPLIDKYGGSFITKGNLTKIVVPSKDRNEVHLSLIALLNKKKINIEQKMTSASGSIETIVLKDYGIKMVVKPKGKVENKGNAFESEFYKMMQDYIAGDDTHKDVFESFTKETKINLRKDVKEIKMMGSLNQKRPLKKSGNDFVISPEGDIGSIVSDIDLILKNGKTVHLSLKMGYKVTFFNSGVATIFKEAEMKNGQVKNQDGVALLKSLGIDNKLFCDSFRWKDMNVTTKEVTKNVTNHGGLKTLIKSGIGYGYIYIHRIGKKYKIKDFRTQASVSRALNINSYSIKYPIGKAKRIDGFIDSDMFSFKMNIRNKQGGLYPTHIMMDYIFKE